MLQLLYNFFCLFLKCVCMFFCSSPSGSYVYDFCSSVEEVEQSEPSEHSWGEQKHPNHTCHLKGIFSNILQWFFFFLLTFTWSKSGLPGRDFCVEKACKFKLKITKAEHLHAYQTTPTWVRLLLTFFVCCTPSMDFDLFFTCFCGEVLVGHWTEMGGLNETFCMAVIYYHLKHLSGLLVHVSLFRSFQAVVQLLMQDRNKIRNRNNFWLRAAGSA